MLLLPDQTLPPNLLLHCFWVVSNIECTEHIICRARFVLKSRRELDIFSWSDDSGRVPSLQLFYHHAKSEEELKETLEDFRAKHKREYGVNIHIVANNVNAYTNFRAALCSAFAVIPGGPRRKPKVKFVDYMNPFALLYGWVLKAFFFERVWVRYHEKLGITVPSYLGAGPYFKLGETETRLRILYRWSINQRNDRLWHLLTEDCLYSDSYFRGFEKKRNDNFFNSLRDAVIEKIGTAKAEELTFRLKDSKKQKSPVKPPGLG